MASTARQQLQFKLLVDFLLAGRAQNPTEPPQEPGENEPVPGTDVAELSSFPNCRCDTYSCSDGPYRLMYSRTTAPNSRGIVNVCFNVTAARTTSTCGRLITDNLAKLEFEIGEWGAAEIHVEVLCLGTGHTMHIQLCC